MITNQIGLFLQHFLLFLSSLSNSSAILCTRHTVSQLKIKSFFLFRFPVAKRKSTLTQYVLLQEQYFQAVLYGQIPNESDQRLGNM